MSSLCKHKWGWEEEETGSRPRTEDCLSFLGVQAWALAWAVSASGHQRPRGRASGEGSGTPTALGTKRGKQWPLKERLTPVSVTGLFWEDSPISGRTDHGDTQEPLECMTVEKSVLGARGRSLLFVLFGQPQGPRVWGPGRCRPLDRDDAAEQGVAHHGRQPRQHRQDLVPAPVRLLFRLRARSCLAWRWHLS